jgi:hypothetical protein
MFNTQPLSQTDPRWSSLQLGFGEADSTIGNYGCTLTCLTMLSNGYGFSETPATLNEKFKALGPGVGFGGETRNLIFFNALDAARPGMRYVDRAWCEGVPAPMDRINANLDANKAVVIQLDQSPSPLFQQHWVLLIGRADGDYLILDPLFAGDGAHSISKRYGFVGDAARIITHVVFFDGVAQPPTPVSGPLTIVVNNDPDIVAIGGLALRDQPDLNGGIVKRLPSGFELGLVESEATARPKLGLPNAWLNVATNGSQGFVAAWLVHAKGAAVRSVARGTKGIAPSARAKRAPAQIQPAWNPLVLVINRPAKASGAKNPLSPSLRSKPSTGKVVAELRPNTPLKALEPEARALKKIGVRGQWIKVQDNKGQIGYVAGVYVHQKKTQPKAQAKG